MANTVKRSAFVGKLCIIHETQVEPRVETGGEVQGTLPCKNVEGYGVAFACCPGQQSGTAVLPWRDPCRVFLCLEHTFIPLPAIQYREAARRTSACCHT